MSSAQAPVITSTKTEVRPPKREEVHSIQDCSHQQVCSWWGQFRKGYFRPYLANIPSSVDGRQLMRLGLPRLTQMCNGNTDAKYIFRALRSTQEKTRLAHQDRIEQNRSRTKY